MAEAPGGNLRRETKLQGTWHSTGSSLCFYVLHAGFYRLDSKLYAGVGMFAKELCSEVYLFGC